MTLFNKLMWILLLIIISIVCIMILNWLTKSSTMNDIVSGAEKEEIDAVGFLFTLLYFGIPIAVLFVIIEILEM